MAFTTINGASATDATTFAGTSGVDVIAAMNTTGNFFAYGAQDDDSITATASANNGQISSITVNGGKGDDTLTFAGAFATAEVVSSFISMGEDDDAVAGAADLISTSVNGNQGVDTLTFGQLTSSTVNGGQDADTITVGDLSSAYTNGNKGTDNLTVVGNLQNATVRGGQDGDSITVTANGTVASSTAVYGDLGTDTIIVNVADGVNISDLTFNGGDGADTLNARGSTTGVVLNGDEGDDRLFGATAYAAGADGGSTLTGGAGNDTFTLASTVGDIANVTTFEGSDADWITDFSNSGDVITASSVPFASYMGTVVAAADFQTTADNAAAFCLAAGDVATFTFDGGNYVFVDVNGNGAYNNADMIFRVNNSINAGVTIVEGEITAIA
ncbi:hypothetical protein [Vulcanococcus sp.]|uniref:hypothetical protein n=1 Tax=Vulcanococcus sp. TaxID=2856995 RepID=UPI003F6A00E2